ncbi:hypothetical protein [Aurantiacibacter flavus]|uniref:DUF982 domain-containing protein n=1 Tax=Aurantiacibacter flavus TaxID=3145232 RepID=A0ABV0D0H0_9SPHN
MLKTIETGMTIMAAPMIYKVDGVQYFAVQAGRDKLRAGLCRRICQWQLPNSMPRWDDLLNACVAALQQTQDVTLMSQILRQADIWAS